MDELSKSWFYLTDDGQSHGPFDIETMKELFKGKYVTENALVWAEGEPEWLPLKMVNTLYAALEFQDDERKPKTSGRRDTALETFEAEIAAIEAVVPEVESPPQDEREFEDDDGTKFVWDSTLRKFRPEGVDLPSSAADAARDAPAAPAAALEYTPDMMVFDVEEEVVPTIQQALAAEQAQIAREAEEQAAACSAKGKPKGDSGKADRTPDTSAGVEAAPAHEGGEGGSGKRKAEGEPHGDAKKSKTKEAGWFDLKTNTSVYVTGIPDDATVEEIVDEFQRCGIIKLDDDKQPRVKIYRDKSGVPKGDCLITYLQEPSVKLALTVMDGRQLRPGAGPNMTVQVAQFQQKGDYVPKAKARKKKAKKVIEQQKERLLNWEGFDDTYKSNEVTVILEHMFSVDELRAPNQEVELQADVMSECKQFGAIDKMKIFATNPEGVISIRFRTPDAAQSCIDLMNGRYFAGRQVQAFMWDGKTSYQPVAKLVETEEEQAARLEKYAAELEKAEQDAPPVLGKEPGPQSGARDQG